MPFPWTRFNAGPHVLLLSVAGLVAVLALRPDGMSLRAQGQPSLPARFDAYIKAHVKPALTITKTRMER